MASMKVMVADMMFHRNIPCNGRARKPWKRRPRPQTGIIARAAVRAQAARERAEQHSGETHGDR